MEETLTIVGPVRAYRKTGAWIAAGESLVIGRGSGESRSEKRLPGNSGAAASLSVSGALKARGTAAKAKRKE
jgi:hypothetical protein